MVEVDGAFAGSVALTRGADVAQKSAELGYWFGRPFWGKGVATEAVRQMCARGFAAWDIVRIFAEPSAATARPAACWRKTVSSTRGQSG